MKVVYEDLMDEIMSYREKADIAGRRIKHIELTPAELDELAAMVGAIEDHDTQPRIRQAIRQLINEGLPIGSGPRGYFRITRMHKVTRAYEAERNARHTDISISVKDRCRYYVVYLAESCGIPYQAVYAMAYRYLYKKHGIDTVKLPAHYRGSVLNFLDNKGLCGMLYNTLSDLEGVLA